MTAEEQAFRAALKLDRADVTTRLVFADWLQEQGRGKDAALQRILAQPAEDRHRLDYADVCSVAGDYRTSGLIRSMVAGTIHRTRYRHWDRNPGSWSRAERAGDNSPSTNAVREIAGPPAGWWPPSADRLLVVARGFPAELVVDAETWFRIGDDKLELFPIERVVLTTRPEYRIGTRTAERFSTIVAGREVFTTEYENGPGDYLPGALAKRWPGVAFTIEAAVDPG